MSDTYNSADIAWFHKQARYALAMARSHRLSRRHTVLWQERAADYRECVIDQYRRKAGWTLAERLAGRRA